MPIPYIFLTGFLGAGKTTVLNGIIKKYAQMRVGVIVNDFGDIGVDGSLIDSGALAGEIMELKAGQIFCSCLSGSFVKSVLAYEEIKPDILIVECSGLAKPSSLKDIVRSISLEAPGVFSYGGMVCLVDGERHMILEKSLMVLSEQMASSDLFLVTKSDLIGPERTEALIDHVREGREGTPCLLSRKGVIEEDILAVLSERERAYRNVKGEDFAGWGEKGRPLTFSFHPEQRRTADLKNLLNPHLNRLYRIKGVVVTEDRGRVFIDGTSAGIELKDAPDKMKTGLVVITHDKELEALFGSF